MKGIILNLLQAVVEQEHGEAVWDEVIDDAGVSGVYTALGNYDDDDVRALVEALAARTGTPPHEVLRWFGRAAMPHLAARYPAFFTPDDPVTFVTTLHDVIHAEVVKLYPGATPPALSFSDVTGRTVTVEYRSDRAMADLAVGFLHGAADVYGATLSIRQAALDPGGTRVHLHCSFEPG